MEANIVLKSLSRNPSEAVHLVLFNIYIGKLLFGPNFKILSAALHNPAPKKFPKTDVEFHVL